MIGPIARVVYFAEMARFADLHWANEHALGGHSTILVGWK